MRFFGRILVKICVIELLVMFAIISINERLEKIADINVMAASDIPASQLSYDISTLLSFTKTINGTLYNFSPKSYYTYPLNDPNQLTTIGIINVPVVPQGNTGTCLAASLVAVANTKGANLTLTEIVNAYQKMYGSEILENSKLIALMKNYGFQATFNNFCLGSNNRWKNIPFEEYKTKSYEVIANTLLKGNPVTVYPATSATTYHATTIVGITLESVNGNQEPYFHIVDSGYGRVKISVNSLLAAMVGPNSNDGCYIGVWNYTQPTPIKIPTLTPTRIPTIIRTSTPTKIPTLTPTRIPTIIRTSIPTSIPTSTVTQTITKICSQCLNISLAKSKGDADCSGITNINDASIWRSEFINGNLGMVTKNEWKADFDCNGKVNLNDISIWRENFIKGLVK